MKHFLNSPNDPKNPIFQLGESKNCLISTPNKCKIIFALTCFDMGTCLYMFEQQQQQQQNKKRSENCQNFIYKICGKSEALTRHQLTHLHNHTDYSRNISLKLRNFKFHVFLFLIRFYSYFHCSVSKFLLFLLN